MALSAGAEIRAFRFNLTALNPMCWECTWVYLQGHYALKFINRSCATHGRLMIG